MVVAMSEIRTINDLKAAFPYQFTERTYELGLTHGWFQNFAQLCRDVDQILKEFGNGTQDFTWLQVKEKLGTARYHFSLIPAFEDLDDYPEKRVITHALAKLTVPASDATCHQCAVCGRPGSMDDTNGYYLTVCDEHKARRQAGEVFDLYPEDDEIAGQAKTRIIEYKAPDITPRRGKDAYVLYLDFDGVLHHHAVYQHRKTGPYIKGGPEFVLFQHAELLVEIIRPYPDLKIVLSTSWTRSYGCAGAAKRLPDELRERVIGACWHSANRHIEAEWSSAPRGMQIWGDVQRRKPKAWIALDDDFLGWPKWALENFIQTDEVLGISDPAVRALLEKKLAEMFADEKKDAT